MHQYQAYWDSEYETLFSSEMILYLCFIYSSYETLYSVNRTNWITLWVFQLVFAELLQLLDAVARLASLGFEKSYHEAVVLMTRSYLSKLAAVCSTESTTTSPEATTERIEVRSWWFYHIIEFNNPLRISYWPTNHIFNPILDTPNRISSDCQIPDYS